MSYLVSWRNPENRLWGGSQRQERVPCDQRSGPRTGGEMLGQEADELMIIIMTIMQNTQIIIMKKIVIIICGGGMSLAFWS
jgi:hypothetical protein